MYKDNLKKKTHFFFHMAYFCRARDDSHEFTRGMLKVVVAYWKVKTPCHAHGECIN